MLYINGGCKKNDFLDDMSPFRGGGSAPLPLKNTQHALKNHFYHNQFLYCHPCLSTGSEEMFIKKGVEGGGQSLGDMSPEKSGFFY